jgi:hypothetical protein
MGALWILSCFNNSALAGTITFNDLTDDVTVTDTTGRITSSSCADETCFVDFSAPANAVSSSSSPAQPPNLAVNILESPGGVLSDILLFSFDLSGGSIEFVSDTDGGPILDPDAGPFIVETGTIQNAVSVTWTLADGSTVVDRLAFVSDSEGGTQGLPEPVSLFLFATGGLWLTAALRRRK